VHTAATEPLVSPRERFVPPIGVFGMVHLGSTSASRPPDGSPSPPRVSPHARQARPPGLELVGERVTAWRRLNVRAHLGEPLSELVIEAQRRAAARVYQRRLGQGPLLSAEEVLRLRRLWFDPEALTIEENLMLLQFREIDPCDYHLLLELDNSVKPRTVPVERIDALPCVIASAAVTGELGAEGDTCAVCMESFEHDSMLTILPCGHRFHRACIREWLSRCSTKCPSDGLPIFAGA